MPRVPRIKVNIKEFVDQVNSKRFSGGQVVVFAARDYPISFMHYLAQYLAHQVGLPMQMLRSESITEILATLSVSFLGIGYLYFIPDVAVFSAQEKKQLEVFLGGYAGEHLVVVGSSQSWSFEDGTCLVALEEFTEIGVVQTMLLAMADKTVVENFVKLLPQQSIRTADIVKLIQFAHGATGIRSQELDRYRTRIISSQTSMFLLAQYWLARDMKKFVKLWQQMSSLYPTEYWISFYSDLLWQALYCVSNKGTNLEQSMVNRLPFSFIKQDWRLYSPRSLVLAHTQVYVLDWEYKNGANQEARLEYFLFRFFPSVQR